MRLVGGVLLMRLTTIRKRRNQAGEVLFLSTETKVPKASGEKVGGIMIQQRFFCALKEGILIPNSVGVIN